MPPDSRHQSPYCPLFFSLGSFPPVQGWAQGVDGAHLVGPASCSRGTQVSLHDCPVWDFSHSMGRAGLGARTAFLPELKVSGGPGVHSAERYDPLTGTWTSIAAMSTRRRYVRVAMLGG